MPEAATQSRARQLAIAVAALLGVVVDSRATMKTLWHPCFASKAELAAAIVNVRPASRGRTDDGKFTGPRDVTLEISVVKHLRQPTAGEDGWNQNDEIDALDLLAEELFDLFVRTDPSEIPDGSTMGTLAQRMVLQHIPANSPEQANTLENNVLESDRLFLTVFTVLYRRWE